MSQQLLEIFLWILFSFFVGCIAGCLLKMAFGGASKPASVAAPPPTPAPTPSDLDVPSPRMRGSVPAVAASNPAPAPIPASQPEPAPQPARPPRTSMPASEGQPKGIPAPRGGKPDALRRISGIGPKIERALHKLGIFHYDQVAGWSENEGKWVDDHLRFKGRIERDKWIDQARLLAEGNEAEFLKLYSTGEEATKKPPKKKTADVRQEQAAEKSEADQGEIG